MTLTLGAGPFSKQPGGVFNFRVDGPERVIYWEDYPRRVRAVLGGHTVVDSEGGKLLHETGILPVLYLPEADFDADLLEPTDHASHCPYKGDAAYWTVRADGRSEENAVWGYAEPLPGAPPLAGYRAVYWDRMDEWWEDDDRLPGRLRDPYHRIDVRSSSRPVRVVASDATVVAESASPLVLYETGLPGRYYIPRVDVRAQVVGPTETRTTCPYKSEASYWSVDLGDRLVPDAAWSYEAPFPEAARIAGHLCFAGEGTETVVGSAS